MSRLGEETYRLRPVGWVRSPLTDRDAAPKQGDEGAPPARIVLRPDLWEAAADLRAGEEVVVLTWLHEGDRDVLSVHPRDDPDRPRQGVFSTRSPDRPNPIGLHAVTIQGIDGNVVAVSSLEAIDGTPVLDIKPVLGPPLRAVAATPQDTPVRCAERAPEGPGVQDRTRPGAQASGWRQPQLRGVTGMSSAAPLVVGVLALAALAGGYLRGRDGGVEG